MRADRHTDIQTRSSQYFAEKIAIVDTLITNAAAADAVAMVMNDVGKPRTIWSSFCAGVNSHNSPSAAKYKYVNMSCWHLACVIVLLSPACFSVTELCHFVHVYVRLFLLASLLITARSEPRKVLFLAPSVCVFCLCMKYLGNR